MNLVDFFDNCRFWDNKRNKFLSKIYFYSICNYAVNYLANVIKTRNVIKKIFLNKDVVVFNDIVKLMKTDLQYQKIHKSIYKK